jgi:trk system potassium uptake protein TrkH
MRKILGLILGHIEILAYLLAFWSLLVLFLEPLISYYTNFTRVENFTALANLVILLLTILKGWLFRTGKTLGRTVIIDMVMLAAGLLLLTYNAKFVIFLLLIRQTYFILQYVLFRMSEGKVFKWLSGNPPVSLMLSFVLVILIGTLLLMLPVSSRQNQVTPFVDALFTSTSATCVTGLIVVDTGTHFTLFGQLVILILIQVGGLGIMTVSTAFALLMGRSIDLKLKNVMNQVVGGTYTINVLQLLKSIVIVTAVIELLGAMVLMLQFSQDYPLNRAIYLSVFHSVSSFCNAGFSLFSANLAGYTNNAIISLTVPALIFLGGIGFTVIIDLYRYFLTSGKVRKLSLHSKIVLTTSAILIVGGFIAFFIMEYYGSMKGYTIQQRFLASLFQSVTTRTAGFNTIDMAALSKGTVLVCILLMFIGASPGSTGGGIKTTTISVLGLTIISLVKGRKDISVYKRRIPASNFREAAGLVFFSITIIFLIVLVLMMTQPHSFDKILFEAFSAFGTVGLSMGITPYLTSLGKILITLLMYIGRIGPLTMIYAFAVSKKHTNINYAEETIAVG